MDLINFLISHGANNFNESIVEASRYGNIELVELFIGLGANNFNEALGSSPVLYRDQYKDFNDSDYISLRNNKLKIAKLFLDHGADNLNYTLSTACNYGNIEIIELMISKGADNLNDCLVSAVYIGSVDTTRLLLRNGANCISGAFKAACNKDHYYLVKMMIYHRADRNLIESYVYTAFRNDNICIVKLLFSHISDQVVIDGIINNVISRNYTGNNTIRYLVKEHGFCRDLVHDHGSKKYSKYLTGLLARKHYTWVIQKILSNELFMKVLKNF
jgi:ankyrin repeat protein